MYPRTRSAQAAETGSTAAWASKKASAPVKSLRRARASASGQPSRMGTSAGGTSPRFEHELVQRLHAAAHRHRVQLAEDELRAGPAHGLARGQQLRAVQAVGALQPGGGRHRLTDDGVVGLERAPHVAGHHLARVERHPHPDLHPEAALPLGAEPVDLGLDGERRPAGHRPVTVEPHRRPPEGDERVARVLDVPAGLAHQAGELTEVGVQQLHQHLGRQQLVHPAEAVQVRVAERHLAPLRPHQRHVAEHLVGDVRAHVAAERAVDELAHLPLGAQRVPPGDEPGQGEGHQRPSGREPHPVHDHEPAHEEEPAHHHRHGGQDVEQRADRRAEQAAEAQGDEAPGEGQGEGGEHVAPHRRPGDAHAVEPVLQRLPHHRRVGDARRRAESPASSRAPRNVSASTTARFCTSLRACAGTPSCAS